VQRVSNAGAQGTRSRATPNAHQRKDQTFEISVKKEERTSPEWLIFTAVKRLSFIALQTKASRAIFRIHFGQSRPFLRLARRSARGSGERIPAGLGLILIVNREW
jgi:hypothetical protein